MNVPKVLHLFGGFSSARERAASEGGAHGLQLTGSVRARSIQIHRRGARRDADAAGADHAQPRAGAGRVIANGGAAGRPPGSRAPGGDRLPAVGRVHRRPWHVDHADAGALQPKLPLEYWEEGRQHSGHCDVVRQPLAGLVGKNSSVRAPGRHWWPAVDGQRHRCLRSDHAGATVSTLQRCWSVLI